MLSDMHNMSVSCRCDDDSYCCCSTRTITRLWIFSVFVFTSAVAHWSPAAEISFSSSCIYCVTALCITRHKCVSGSVSRVTWRGPSEPAQWFRLKRIRHNNKSNQIKITEHDVTARKGSSCRWVSRQRSSLGSHRVSPQHHKFKSTSWPLSHVTPRSASHHPPLHHHIKNYVWGDFLVSAIETKPFTLCFA